MTLSAPAQKLLSEQPELVKEIATSFTVQVVQAIDVPKNHWGEFVQKNSTKPTCPHCGIPTDGTSNDQCYKAPQRDWEILAFRNIETGEIEPPIYLTTDSLTKQTSIIHSVKRLSDGEVFTIGDTITDDWHETTIMSITSSGTLCGDRGSMDVIGAKVINPLLITEDGKPAYEGDKIYWIPSDIGLWDIQEQVISASLHKVHRETIKYFSTKEAAEEYILNNKPCLSLLEATSILERNRDISIIEKLVALAKSKQKT